MVAVSEALSENEIRERLKSLPAWAVQNKSLVRSVDFPSYLAGLDFVNRLAHEANRIDHHPSLVLDYKKVTVTYSTHSAGGITEKDVESARLADRLIRENEAKTQRK